MHRSGIFIDGRAASKRIGAFSEVCRELTDMDTAVDDRQPLHPRIGVLDAVGIPVRPPQRDIVRWIPAELHPDPLSVP
jgi:hypothetical protein